jgi:hypothetical protein
VTSRRRGAGNVDLTEQVGDHLAVVAFIAFPDPGPETTVHFSPLDWVQVCLPFASTVQFVNFVGTHLHVAPCGQFAAATAEFVNEPSDVKETNPKRSRHIILYMKCPLFRAEKVADSSRMLSPVQSARLGGVGNVRHCCRTQHGCLNRNARRRAAQRSRAGRRLVLVAARDFGASRSMRLPNT